MVEIESKKLLSNTSALFTNVVGEDQYWNKCQRKHFFENELIWKPQLYFGFSFRNKELWQIDINEIESQTLSWLNRLASYADIHGLTDSFFGHHNGKPHVHGIVCADKPIESQLAKSLWHSGNGCFRQYNHELGGVIYNATGHDEMHLSGHVACHKNRGSCRRGRCPYKSGIAAIIKS